MIKNELPRSVLHEGRTYGIGFGYLKKIGKDKYETVTPVSACKDYLNDVVYSENLDVPISACGLHYSKKNIFDGKHGYLAMDFLDFNKGTPSYRKTSFPADKENFEKNYKNIQTVINWIEDKLDIGHTEITKDGDLYLVKGPHYWHTSTYLVSLYALLLRMAIHYKEGSVAHFLNNYPSTDPDAGSWSQVKPKLMLLLSGYNIKQKFEKSTGNAIHNYGIMHYRDFNIKE